MEKGFFHALMVLLLSFCTSSLSFAGDVGSPNVRLNCELDPANFDFTDESGTVFNSGTREDADRAYRLLQGRLDDLKGYRRGTIFYAQGTDSLTTHICVDLKCAAEDLLTGLQRCVAGKTDPEDSCRPLAVAYEGNLYCLLQPREEFGAPFIPYNPFPAEGEKE